jgi:hypothetical protein
MALPVGVDTFMENWKYTLYFILCAQATLDDDSDDTEPLLCIDM